MANFGFARLAVVAPYAPHWREARSAVGAPDLLHNAREFATLSEAVADCTLVAGTGTVDRRKPDQRVVLLEELPALLADQAASGGRAALVFGPEKHGLTRDDLSICQLLVEIPTDPRQPSMNLGQAVAVCLYELAVRRGDAAASHFQRDRATSSPASVIEPAPPATCGALERLAEAIEQAMSASGYSPANMRNANRLDMRVLLRRLALSEPDARRTLRLFRRIVWRLERAPKLAPKEQRSHESSTHRR